MKHLLTVSYDIDQGDVKGKVVLLYDYQEVGSETCNVCKGNRTSYKPFLAGVSSVKDEAGELVFPQLSEQTEDDDEETLNTALWLELVWRAKAKLEEDADLIETSCDCDLVADSEAPIISGERDRPRVAPKYPEEVGVDVKIDPEE